MLNYQIRLQREIPSMQPASVAVWSPTPLGPILFFGEPPMGKDPWMKLWVSDWMGDAKLQSCSLAARGLLMQMMCVMHQAEPYGHFLIFDKTPTKVGVKRVLNVHQTEYKNTLKELLNVGVLIEVDGVIVCQRMVKDQAYRETRRRTGKMGGNPVLDKVDVKVDLNPIFQKPYSREQKEITTTTGTTDMCVLPPDDGLLEKAKQVIEYLNESTGSRYRPVGKNVDLVRARLQEGFSVEDCKEVIEGQKLDPYFLSNPKYFRPSTLFGASKFESYLQAAAKMKSAWSIDPEELRAKKIREAKGDAWEAKKQMEELKDGRDNRQGHIPEKAG